MSLLNLNVVVMQFQDHKVLEIEKNKLMYFIQQKKNQLATFLMYSENNQNLYLLKKKFLKV